MARFNSRARNKTVTTNLAGGKAYQESPKLEFASILLTSMVKNQFYRSADETMDRLVELMGQLDPEFVAKAAIFARTEFGMRSITHVAAAELANEARGTGIPRRFLRKVIYRPDDITEILSYYMNKYGKPLPYALKRGLAESFDNFDGYQLAKYRGEGKAMSLVDAVNLVHPVPNPEKTIDVAWKDYLAAMSDEQRELVELTGRGSMVEIPVTEALVLGLLKSTDTWEAKISNAGKAEDKAAAKADAWKELVQSRKIGYFALLRNMRNIMEQAPELVENACAMLTDRKLIKKSLVLPFRFYTAFKTIGGSNRKVDEALHEAFDLAMDNVPTLDGKTLIAVDDSGSMTAGWWNNDAGNPPIEQAAVLASVIYKSNDADLIMFSHRWHKPRLYHKDSGLSIVDKLMEDANGGGTNFHLIFDAAKKKYDRIIVLSDMQGWMNGGSPNDADCYKSYKRIYKADPYLYSFDLTGNGTLQFPESKMFCMAGYSDKIFDVMKVLEQDKQALINKIEAVEL